MCSGERMSWRFLRLSLITAGLSIDCIDHFHDGTRPETHTSLSPFPLCPDVRLTFPQKREEREEQEEIGSDPAEFFKADHLL